MSASAIVVLPDPDSPISASTSPRLIENPMSVTITVSRPPGERATTLRSSTLTCAPMSALGGQRARPARQRVDEKVRSDRDRRNGDCRHQDRERSLGKAGNILADERAEVGIGRLHAEAQEAQS